MTMAKSDTDKDARNPPVVLTPEDLARRDEAAHKLTENARRAGAHIDIKEIDSPLRDPGEPTPPGTDDARPPGRPDRR
jgi:hypothetical protein